MTGDMAESEQVSEDHNFSDALLRASLGVATRNGDQSERGKAEWLAAATVALAGVYLRARLGPGIIGSLSVAGGLPLIVALLRSGLFRRQTNGGDTAQLESLARLARHVTPLLLLVFPVVVIVTGRWRSVLGHSTHDADLWLGTVTYVLAFLELIQLRTWAMLRT